MSRMSEWMVRTADGQTLGPMSSSAVLEGIGSGVFDAEAEACRVGSNQWLMLEAFDEFADALQDEASTRVVDSPWFLKNRAGPAAPLPAKPSTPAIRPMPVVPPPPTSAVGSRPPTPGLPPPPTSSSPRSAPLPSSVPPPAYDAADDAATRVASPGSYGEDDDAATRVASPGSYGSDDAATRVAPPRASAPRSAPKPARRAPTPAAGAPPPPTPAAGSPAPPIAPAQAGSDPVLRWLVVLIVLLGIALVAVLVVLSQR